MNPQPGDLHVNKPLTDVCVSYMQQDDHFAYWKLFPPVSVQKQSDIFAVFPKGAWFRNDAEYRANGTESAGGQGFDVDLSKTYYCNIIGRHYDVSDNQRANFDNPIFDPEKNATKFVSAKLMLAAEASFAAKFFAAALWSNNPVGGVSGGGTDFVFWSDYVNADPIADVDVWKNAILNATGKEPNRLLIGNDVWLILKNHPAILARMSVTQQRTLTVKLVAEILELDKLVVGKSIYNAAAIGATDDIKPFYTKDALLTYSNPNDKPDINDPSAGYSFVWAGRLGSNNQGARIKKFRMEHLTADRVEGELCIDQRIVASDLGVFFNGAIAP